MKSLFKSIVKFIYCIVLPGSMLVVLYHVTTDPVLSEKINSISYWVLVASAIAVCANGVFWMAIMSETRMVPRRILPKLSTEIWRGIGFGLGMEKTGNGFIIVFPFIVFELSW